MDKYNIRIFEKMLLVCEEFLDYVDSLYAEGKLSKEDYEDIVCLKREFLRKFGDKK